MFQRNNRKRKESRLCASWPFSFPFCWVASSPDADIRISAIGLQLDREAFKNKAGPSLENISLLDSSGPSECPSYCCSFFPARPKKNHLPKSSGQPIHLVWLKTFYNYVKICFLQSQYIPGTVDRIPLQSRLYSIKLQEVCGCLKFKVL